MNSQDTIKWGGTQWMARAADAIDLRKKAISRRQAERMPMIDLLLNKEADGDEAIDEYFHEGLAFAERIDRIAVDVVCADIILEVGLMKESGVEVGEATAWLNEVGIVASARSRLFGVKEFVQTLQADLEEEGWTALPAIEDEEEGA